MDWVIFSLIASAPPGRSCRLNKKEPGMADTQQLTVGCTSNRT